MYCVFYDHLAAENDVVKFFCAVVTACKVCAVDDLVGVKDAEVGIVALRDKTITASDAE